jgi:hypothetical protein
MSRLIASAAAVCVVTLALALSRAQSPNEICCSRVYNLSNRESWGITTKGDELWQVLPVLQSIRSIPC